MKKYQPFLIAIILVALVGVGYMGWRRANVYQVSPGVVATEDVSIDEGTRAQAEARIVEYTEVLTSEELSSDNRIAYLVSLAAQYELLGQYEAAKEEMEAALELGPNSPPVNVTYSRLLYRMKDYENALWYARQAIDVRPDLATSWLWYAELDEQIRRFGTTNEIYEQALAATSFDAEVFVSYAYYLERTSQIEEAVRIWGLYGEKHEELAGSAQQNIARLLAEE